MAPPPPILTRGRPTGDLFVMQLPDSRYLFGRVILADVPQGCAPMPGANLIYIYDRPSPTIDLESADLRPGKLLIPPQWSQGAHTSLSESAEC